MSEDWLSKLQKDVSDNWMDQKYTYQEIQNAPLPDPEWFIDTLIPNPGLIAITGRPGAFKTFLVHWMAMRLSAGLPFFATIIGECDFVNPYKEKIGVAFIEEEMNARQIKMRTNDLKSWDHPNFHWFISAGFSLRDEKKVKELKEFIEKNNIKLIVLDPFTTCAGMKDENSNAEAREVMDIIRHEFVDSAFGCSVIFIHHPAKGEGTSENIRGAGDILGKCDMHFVITKIGEEPTSKISFKCKKTRYKQPKDFIAELVEDGNDLGKLEWIYTGKMIDEFKKERDELKEKILDAMQLDVEYKKKEVAEAVDCGEKDNKFRACWDELEKKKKIIQEGRYSFKKAP